MKTAILTLLLMTSVSGVALAADKKTDVNSSGFAVEKMICSRTYIPATGAQSPNYQPGVDVNGNAVAPADVSAQMQPATPDYIEVPMTVDLAQKLGTLPAGAEVKLPVANLKLYKDGRVEYNGQDITSNTETLCGVAKKGDVTGQQHIEPAAGQEPMTTAGAVTTNPPPKRTYVTPAQPEDLAPQPGSVAQSSTSPQPRIIYKLQQGVVNKAPVTTQ